MEVTVQLDPKDVETYAAFVRSRDRLRRVLFPLVPCALSWWVPSGSAWLTLT
jgi:hypothetical protein